MTTTGGSRLVIALGGNALLHREEPFTDSVQRRNVQRASRELAPLLARDDVVITHGNGPQIGYLALQHNGDVAPFDTLAAQAEGMIGYLLISELAEATSRQCVALLTRVEVCSEDPAFLKPEKFIGPRYAKQELKELRRRHPDWHFAKQGDEFRRVVPSPIPQRIVELSAIEVLLNHGAIVICTGGGGIPIVHGQPGHGLDAVVDKDLASALLASSLGATDLLMLTDIDGVRTEWGEPTERTLRQVSPETLSAYQFEPGSMQPKIAAAINFCRAVPCGRAYIGAIEDAQTILAGGAGTVVGNDLPRTWW